MVIDVIYFLKKGNLKCHIEIGKCPKSSPNQFDVSRYEMWHAFNFVFVINLF